jgi:hypothetical protein
MPSCRERVGGIGQAVSVKARPGLGMVVAAVLLALVLPGAARGAAWITPGDASLSAGGSVIAPQPDSVAMSPAGNLVLGWVTYDSQQTAATVHLVLRPAGGPGLAEQTYVENVSGLSDPRLNLSVAVNDAGEAIAVWDTGGVLSYVLRAPGGGFGSTQHPPVYSFQNVADAPAVGLGTDGTATLVYGARCTVPNAGLRSEAVAVRRAPDGTWSSPDGMAAAPNTCGDGTTFLGFQIDELPDGHAIVGFVEAFSDGSSSVWSATRASTTGSFSGGMLASANHPGEPQTSIEPGGASVSAWSDTNGVHFSYHPRTGADVPGGPGVADASAPKVAMGANGEAFLVYASASSAPGAIRIAPDGSVADPQRFSPTTGSLARPSVASDLTGRALLVFRNNHPDDGIETLVRAPGGVFGTPTKLGSGVADFPVVAADGSGDGAALWMAYEDPNSSTIVTPRLRGYDGAPPAITTLSAPTVLAPGQSGTFSLAASDMWGPISAAWTFSDGGTATGPSVEHAFSAAGLTSASATVADAAGNTATGTAMTSVSGPPSVSIATPADGAAYALGSKLVAGYACAAGPFGGVLGSCSGTIAPGAPIDTSRAGSFTFTVTATDTDGQGTAATAHYRIRASRAQIGALLSHELTPPGKCARIAALLRSGKCKLTFRALEAGTGEVDWYELPPGTHHAAHTGKAKPVLIAAGHARFSTAGRGTITIQLTATGRRLLKHAKRLKVTARGIFTPTGETSVVARKTFTLR